MLVTRKVNETQWCFNGVLYVLRLTRLRVWQREVKLNLRFYDYFFGRIGIFL